MGRGKSYICKNCCTEYSVRLGVGMMFPTVFKETINDIKDGKYGEEFKESILCDEYIVPDAESYLYYCDRCGRWEVEQDLSLFAPNSVEDIKKKKYGIKTVDELGEIPYVMSFDLEENYHLIKKYEHNCPKCKAEMRKVDDAVKDKTLKTLTCPNCGTKNNPINEVAWD